MRPPLFLLLLASTLPAAPLEFSLSGVITQVDPLLAGSFTIGQSALGLYRFESTTPDSAADPASGVYFNAGPLFTATVGVFNFTASAVNITVSNLPAVDIYRVEGSSASGPNLGGFVITSLVLSLTDNTTPVNALASDTLPLLPPALTGFDVRTLTLTFVNGATVASVDALGTSVPEPALALPLCCALCLSRRRADARRNILTKYGPPPGRADFGTHLFASVAAPTGREGVYA